MRFVRQAAIAFTVAIACATAPARAEVRAWSDVFAGVRDTVVFIATDGTLVRAPFDLAVRETLWTPPPGQHLVRVSASPDGRRIAWIARGFDSDTTRLWIDGPGGTVLRLRYFAFQAQPHVFVHTEPDVPSIEDRNARGARFVEPSARMRRNASNSLAWSPDSRIVVVGYDGGIAAIPVEGGPGFGLTELGPVTIEPLQPAPMYLVDAIQLSASERLQRVDQLDLVNLLTMNAQKLAPGRAPYVVTLSPGGWQAYPVQGIATSRARAAGPRTVWWSEGPTVRAVRAGDPGVTEEFALNDRVVWLGYDAPRADLLWVSARRLGRAVSGAPPTVVLETTEPIRKVLASSNGDRVGIVAGDSLLVWNPDGDRFLGFELGGAEPCELIEGAGGQLFTASNCGARSPLELAKLDPASGRLVEIETPRVRRAEAYALRDGSWILVCNPTPKAPRMFHAYDVGSGAWVGVENPGISGWERIRAVE